MRATNLHLGLLLSFFSFGAAISTNSQNSDERSKKHFSLFSVVTFKNEECTSESGLAGGIRQGTCYTTTECTDKNGMKSGNCASGFGVCCIFLENTGLSATITNNRTYLRNSEFPAVTAATAAQTIVYTLQKMNAEICQIRLDFVAFVIGGPINSLENIVATTESHCTNDNMFLAQSGGATMPTICGAITGEHLYVDLGALATDTSILTINTVISTTLPPSVAQRIWDIKTSQIECYASYRAPQGCHRYFTTDYGKIISLNFFKVTGSTPALQSTTAGQNSGIELATQRINTCIRRSKGMGCVEYQVCGSYNGIALTETTGTAGTNAGIKGRFNEGWSIDIDTNPFVIDAQQDNVGMIDAQCSGDYVEIPSSWTGACGAASGGRQTISTRYCGARLGANFHRSGVENGHLPVCDCSEPFVVRHGSDMANDKGGKAGVATDNVNTVNTPRGFCLDFRQHPVNA